MIDPTLLDRLRSAAEHVFAGRGVLAAYAFGSRVSGRPLPDSDLDIGYYLEGYRSGDRLSIDNEMRLAATLTHALAFDVDLHNLAEAPLELRGRVLEQGVRIYSGDPAKRVALERDVLARYHDYKDIFRRMHEIRLRRSATDRR
jgi:predicted nucleotidyltransferase